MSFMPALWEERGMMAPAAAIAAQSPLLCLFSTYYSRTSHSPTEDKQTLLILTSHQQ